MLRPSSDYGGFQTAGVGLVGCTIVLCLCECRKTHLGKGRVPAMARFRVRCFDLLLGDLKVSACLCPCESFREASI